MQGLQNLGSTCAVNSLIQIICREPNIRDALIHKNLPADSLSGNLQEILNLMHNENKSLIPGKFITKLFESLNGIFHLGEQMDIGELWIFLFDKIATELNTIPDAYYDLPPVADEYADDINLGITYKDDLEYKRALISCQQLRDKYNYMRNRFNNNKSSTWLESCQGFFLNIIKCNKCQNVLYNFEPFTSISLDISDDQPCPTITRMLRDFLQEEKRCGDWKCCKCNENTEYTKTVKIWKMPPVLVFIIKRFDANLSSKNNKPIDVNKSICFKRGAILSNIDDDLTYTLSSLGMHFGSLQGGHYCAMCNIEEEHEKRKSFENIIFYDDLNISQVTKDKFEHIIEKNADGYMIIYSTKC